MQATARSVAPSAPRVVIVDADRRVQQSLSDLLVLTGDLGAGKTCFTQGLGRGLGVTERITSPTFTIGHRYHGRVDVSHLDLYRFAGVSAAEWGDLEPYFEDAIVFVEWPEAAGEALPPIRAAVVLRHANGGRRTITLEERC